MVKLLLKSQPEGPPSIRQALLVSKNALHFAKSGGAVYNDHVRAQPGAYGQVEATGDWQKNARLDVKMTVRLLYTVVPVQTAY